MRYAWKNAMSRRLLPLFALVAAIVTGAATARAQTITLSETGITRSVAFRTDPTSRLWISRSDCLVNDTFYFPLTLSDYGSYGLEVWAGESGDCNDASQRSSSSALCWRVYSGVPTSYTALIPVRVQDIIAEGKPAADAGAGTAADCDERANASSATGPVQVTLYFMLMSGTSNVGTGQTWVTKYDLKGPEPPTGISVGVGGTLLKVSWSANADTDVTGYTFFCDPPPGGVISNVTSFEAGPQAGSGGAGGAGGSSGAAATGGAAPVADASTDGGADASDAASGAGGSAAVDASAAGAAATAGTAGSTAASNSCNSGVALVTGQLPSADALARNQCGTAGKADTAFTIKGLTDYQPYAVAVASTDTAGNVGPLSTIACGMPQPVIDFYGAYRAAGGTAGGGSCAVGRGWHHSRWLALLAGAALLALIVRARRRR
jgi:hypothetical protein